jgi:hypothetical protein
MNYCVYYKKSLSIAKITSVAEESLEVSYITITPEEVESFCSGRHNLNEFYVEVDPLGNYSGKLVSVKEISKREFLIDNKIYAIPKNKGTANLTIYQNTTEKQCVARLDDHMKERASLGFNKKIISVAACYSGDPHLPSWVWDIKISDLAENDVKINYSGQDTISFFTQKLFDSYSHEQI